MKKVLFATTALVLSAGFASADISLSGYGRFGLSYDSGNSGAKSKTWVEQRLRLDIKATTQTDAGVMFGAKFRIQYDDGDSSGGAGANAAQFIMGYEGLTVQVGNVTTAIDEDTAGLFYASEIGLTDTSFGDSRSSFYTYSSKAYGTSASSRTGVYAKYTIAGVTAEASYIDPNQYGDNGALGANEKSLVLSYATGPLTVAAGATWDGAGEQNNNIWYVAGKYAFTDQWAAGLTYIDEGKDAGYDLGKTITAYASYTTGPLEVLGYVSHDSDVAEEIDYKKDTVFGIGANYDLGGGVSLKGALHRNQDNDTYGEFGVKFKF